MDKVTIFDTTLRDGEQSPGATMTLEEKLDVGRQLARLGVDVIEAGFPIASPGDLESVRQIALEVKGPTICGLARCNKNDIDTCWEAVKHAEKSRIHVFLASSDIHLEYKLRMTRQQALEQAREMVAYARSLCPDIEYSPEDAGRTDPEYLYQVLEAMIDAGATTVNIPDTVGYTTPEEFGALIRSIQENVPNIDKAVISVHCHNDLGLATANSLAAVRNGARQIECTVNGIGERAGNAALEEIVMALKTRGQFFGVEIDIDATQITRISSMVSTHTGIPIQPNKAIVGANAFAHEAGIHQHGMLKNPLTYEIMTPESVGLSKNALVLGKHSGRHAFKEYLDELGHNLDRDNLDKVFTRFKLLADKKKLVTDADIEAIITDELFQPPEVYKLENVQISCGSNSIPTATVRLRTPEGDIVSDAALGDGPVDAVYQAINRVINVQNELVEFSIQAITKGMDAVGEVTIRISADVSTNGDTVKRIFSGRGIDTDIIVACAKAYMFALNKLLSAKRDMVRQHQWEAGGNYGPHPTRATFTIDGKGSKDLFKS